MTADDDRKLDGAEVDAEDDDLQLAGMRALWRSMPDEEPSNNGLAALMAAAREKAEEMKPRESWWQRLLVQLRRPPVLALATVVLLVGGGVIISQRGDMKVTATAEDHTVSATSQSAAGSSTAVAQEELEGVIGGQLADEAAPAPAAAVPAPTTGAATPPPAEPAAKGGRTVATPSKAATKAKPKLEVQQRERLVAPDPVKPADKPAPEAPGASAGGAAPAMSIAVDDMATTAPSALSTSDSKEAAPSRRAAATSKAEPARSIDELIKQCEATAARGDCAAAKNLAAQIEKTDPKAYRARVITNATIKACF